MWSSILGRQRGNFNFIALCIIIKIVINRSRIIYVDSSRDSSGSGDASNSPLMSLDEVFSFESGQLDVQILSNSKPYYINMSQKFLEDISIQYNGIGRATILLNESTISWNCYSNFKMKNILLKTSEKGILYRQPFLIFSGFLETSEVLMEVYLY